MQPYSAPKSHILPSTNPDVDITDSQTPLIAKAGAGVVFFAGSVLILMCLQTLAMVHIYGVMKYVPYLLGVLGVVMCIFGAQIFRARAWAPVASIVMASVTLIASTMWLIWSFSHGLFALFALIAPFFSMLSIILSALSIAPCRKASDARARLSAAGLEFGL